MMTNCREAAALCSERLDRRLPLGKRIALALHLALCSLCRRYAKQMLFLEKSCAELAARPSGEDALSPQARERIRARIREKSRL